MCASGEKLVFFQFKLVRVKGKVLKKKKSLCFCIITYSVQQTGRKGVRRGSTGREGITCSKGQETESNPQNYRDKGLLLRSPFHPPN